VALQEMKPNIIEHLKFSEEFLIIEVKAPKSFVERDLLGLDLRKIYNLNVIAIRSAEKNKVIIPSADTIINEGDTLVIATDAKTARELEELK